MDRRNFAKALAVMSAALIAGPPFWAGFRNLSDQITKEKASPKIKLVGVGTAGCLAIKGLCGKGEMGSNL